MKMTSEMMGWQALGCIAMAFVLLVGLLLRAYE